MLISRVWLESMLGPGLHTWSDEELARTITSLGLEVEAVTRVGDGLEAIRVGEVLSVAPHPGADKLRVVELDAGRGPQTVVCGAPNVPPPGGKVAFAPTGTRLPGGLEIAGREVRGVASSGMIASEEELGLGPDNAGILVLPSAWSAGDRLVDRVPGILDTIFALGITPNRPDALGHVGVARDLALKPGLVFRPSEVRLPSATPSPALARIECEQRCGRYIGLVFGDVVVGPSPLWLRVRLGRIGLRPINNIVDITNLVMMEWGQPLHAFDRERLQEGRIVVRRARPQETLTLLDGRTLELTEDDMVIADAVKPVALAGVMGGEGSGVTAETKTVLLETAWFQPAGVRRSARRHGLATDSSYRFERGVDHGAGLAAAAAHAGHLLEDVAQGRCIASTDVEGELPRLRPIAFRPSRSTLVLGMDIPDGEAAKIFAGLGIEADRSDPGRWSCRAPTHRPDLVREEDLIEELMRHHGLDALPAVPTVPSTAPLGDVPSEPPFAGALVTRTVDALCEAGLHEQVSLVFASTAELEPFETPEASAVKLSNPLRVQAPYLRTHVLPGLLKAAGLNLARHTQPVRLFEVGRVYRWPGSSEHVVHHEATAALDAELPLERARAGVLLARGGASAAEVCAILLGVLARLGHTAEPVAQAEADRIPWLHPGVQVTLRVRGGAVVGVAGACHPDLLERFKLPTDVDFAYGELWLEAIPAADPPRFRALPRFPGTSRDVSLDLLATIPAAAVAQTLIDAEQELASEGEDPARLAVTHFGLPSIAFVEDYRGAGVEAGRRALLLRLDYAAHTRSVTDEEVQRRHEAVVALALGRLRTRDNAARVR